MTGPIFPVGKDLEILEHHPWGLHSLAGGYHLKAEPPFRVGAELHCTEAKVIYHHSHRILQGEGDKGAGVQPTAARAKSPWARSSRTQATHLVLLLINQLVALNSEPASGGSGSRVMDMGSMGMRLGQGQQILCPIRILLRGET